MKFNEDINIQEHNYRKCLQGNTIVCRMREFRYEQWGNWIDFCEDFYMGFYTTENRRERK